MGTTDEVKAGTTWGAGGRKPVNVEEVDSIGMVTARYIASGRKAPRQSVGEFRRRYTQAKP